MKFYFCETCGKRITDTDIESGQGKNKKLKGVYCDQCAVGVMTIETMPLTDDDARKILGKPSDSKASVKRDSGAHRTHPLKRSPLSTQEPAFKTTYIWAGLGAAVVVALALLLLLPNHEKNLAQAPQPRPSKDLDLSQNARSTVPPQNTPSPTTPSKGSQPPPDTTTSPPVKEPEPDPSPTSRPIKPATKDPVATPAETAPVVPTDPSPPTSPDTKTGTSTTAPAEPKTEEKVPAVSDKDLQTSVLTEAIKLARKNQMAEAEALLDRKARDAAFATIASNLKQEKSDLAAARTSKSKALEALRGKAGTVFTVNLGTSKVTGVVRDGPGADRVSLAMKDGPELPVRAEQLSADDVDALLPLVEGQNSAQAWKQRALVWLSAGDIAKATHYFKKAGEDGEPYLLALSAQREQAAEEDWGKAEKLFESANWKPAKAAYESFQARYADTPALAGKQETLKARMSAIATALTAGADMVVDLGGLKLVFVQIPAGEFEMGSNSDAEDEKPAHRVKISRAFFMGKFLITQPQYEKVTGTNPCLVKGDDLPVERVNYNDALSFCKLASQLTGKNITLPTEAEWEYACRAGTKTKYYTGDTEAALAEAGWYDANSSRNPQPVGKKKPNAWGLYDMHGNVWQICMDWYTSDYYAKSEATDPTGPARPGSAAIVLRGGSRTDIAAGCRSSCRSNIWQGDTSFFRPLGFRVVIRPGAETGTTPQKR